MEKEFLQNLTVGESPLPEEVIDAILGQHEKAMAESAAAHEQAISRLRLSSAVEMSVSRAGGRNLKAISALLDMEALSQSKDVPAAVEAAVQKLKKDNGYLFDAPTPPPYAKNTGTAPFGSHNPVTLVSALRERMRK